MLNNACNLYNSRDGHLQGSGAIIPPGTLRENSLSESTSPQGLLTTSRLMVMDATRLWSILMISVIYCMGDKYKPEH